MNHQEFYGNNVVYEKSYNFAIRIVKAHQYLSEEKREYILSQRVS